MDGLEQALTAEVSEAAGEAVFAAEAVLVDDVLTLIAKQREEHRAQAREHPDVAVARAFATMVVALDRLEDQFRSETGRPPRPKKEEVAGGDAEG